MDLTGRALDGLEGTLLRRNRFMLWGVAVLVVVSSGWVALRLLVGWLTADPYYVMVCSVPGMDGAPEVAQGGGLPNVVLEGLFQKGVGVPSSLPGYWPQFRGADSDNQVKATVKLANRWPESGPPVLWSVELGEGHAAPAIWKGRVFLLDYDEIERADTLRCFSLADGSEIWRRSYALPAKRNHGLSRTIPAVSEAGIVTMGPRCHVVCLDPETGDFKWGIDLQRDFGTREPLWFTGQCPLVDEGLVLLAPAGPEVLMMAVSVETGEMVWRLPNPEGWNMSHSSIMPLMLHGRKMYVYCAIGGMVGVSPEGELLWSVPWNASVVAPSPVAVADDRLFMTAGYGAGSLMVEVKKQGDGYAAEVLKRQSPKEWLASEQQTPIFVDGLLYGIMPKDAGALKRQFVCYNPITFELVWSSGKEARFGLGPYILADQKFFVLDDDGTLTMLEKSSLGYTRLGQHRVLEGHDAWGPMVFAGTRLLLRDSKRMVCLEMGGGE
jgi:outer membrane protein assembly factor BamB